MPGEHLDLTGFGKQATGKPAERTEIPKIGIFGWTGTGKTTYIAVLYYLLAKGKIPGITLSAADANTNAYILPLVDSLIKAETWEAVSDAIVGTIDVSELYFNVTLRGRSFPIQINDYPGEAIEADRPREIVEKFLLQCDALILFHALSDARRSVAAGFYRQNEFNSFLGKLASGLKRDRIKTPMVLVITKSDQLRLKKIETKQLARSIARDECTALRALCDDFKATAVSSKDSFEHYIRSSGQPPGGNEVGSRGTIDTSDISAPFLHILERLRHKRLQRLYRPYKIAAAAIAFTLIACYCGAFFYTHSALRKLDQVATFKTDRYEIYEAYTDFYTNSPYLPLFPPLELEAKEKSEKYWTMAEDDLFTEIRQADADYETVLNKSNLYLNRYRDRGRYIKEVQDSQTRAIKEKERIAELERQRAEEERKRAEALARAEAARNRGRGSSSCLGSAQLAITILAALLSSWLPYGRHRRPIP